jgi:glycosyltransferase involved in cell wall biosynthesis
MKDPVMALPPTPRLLFVMKNREQPWGPSPYGYQMSSGLRNSVRFLVEMLNLAEIEAKWVEVMDNNKIDSEVTSYRPTHVIIEAFWVVPVKFDILMKLHPTVKWLVRDHSETPFIANEGIFCDWLKGYLSRGIEIMANAPRAVTDLQAIALAYNYPTSLISYGPNYYPVHALSQSSFTPRPAVPGLVRIACFGAIRPLKNHLVQAVAALRYARARNCALEFHINSTRVEGGASPILRNLRALFTDAPKATLVESPWLEHDVFLELLREMDICLQCSFSETFNIVCADAMACSVPVIASLEVPWLGTYAQADPTSSTSILAQMLVLNKIDLRERLVMQWRDLSRYCMTTLDIWQTRFETQN